MSEEIRVERKKTWRDYAGWVFGGCFFIAVFCVALVGFTFLWNVIEPRIFPAQPAAQPTAEQQSTPQPTPTLESLPACVLLPDGTKKCFADFSEAMEYVLNLPSPLPTQPVVNPTQPVTVQPQTGGQTITSGGCPEPEDVDNWLGKPIGTVVKVTTESCAFTHRSFPNTETFTCLQGEYIGQWVCTFDVQGDKVTHEGIGQSAVVWGMTMRFMEKYPGENVCNVANNEDLNGQSQSPAFRVRFQPVPGGIQECPGVFMGE